MHRIYTRRRSPLESSTSCRYVACPEGGATLATTFTQIPGRALADPDPAALIRHAPQRPALWILLFLFIGILLHDRLPVHPILYASLAAAWALAACLFRRHHVLSITLLAPAILTIGLATAQVQRYWFAPDHLIHQVGADPVLTRLRLRIVEPLIIRASDRGLESAATVAQVLAARSDQGWRPQSGKLLVRLQPPAAGWRPGVVVQAIGDLSRIEAPANPGEYDWQLHFAAENIALRFSVKHAQESRILADTGQGLLWLARLKVRHALDAGFGDKRQLDRALLQALLLGDNDDRLEEVWTDFRRSGTAHHLSIGGMHIAAMSWVVLLLCILLMLHPRNALLITLTFAIGYALLTKPSPPVLRSVLMCSAAGLALLMRRNTDILQCLCVGACAMLLINPLDALNPGFQLSVGTVIGMILLTRPLQTLIGAFEHQHDRMARRIRPPTGIAAIVWFLRNRAVSLLAAGVIAWIVSMPVIALQFRQINSWAVPCSILLEPIVLLALLTGLAKMALSLVIPPIGAIFAPIAAIPSAWMRESVSLMAHLPGSELPTCPIPVWLLLPYFALVALPLLPSLRRRRIAWLGPALAAFLACLLPLWTYAHAQMQRDGLRLTILSVGNGSCAVLELPSGQTAMVDCGTLFGDRLFDMTIQPFLRDRGILRVNHLLITHADRDHNSALPDMVAAYQPQTHLHATLGQTQPLDDQCRYEILWPPPGTPLTGNNASSVIRISYANQSILFAGDIEEQAIQGLLQSGQNLRATLLLAPHHGSAVLSTPQFIQAVAPDQIICSSGSRLSGRQKAFDALLLPRTAFRTGRLGAVIVQINPAGQVNLQPFRPHAP